ncbi:hypothetical protein FBT96_16930 [Rhodobacter capsulatus]|uniref:DUF4157 domain-containing protein n=1 Tax=Rhodobacter capsulatus TaxID=1061 RepID=A0A4U1JNY9_RHOCA|nr:hypothetical protein [Rhodobacter capsulatus]TKD15449.1 hypothetical protein FBT96_16930 [Rhodobacter capsulatus]
MRLSALIVLALCGCAPVPPEIPPPEITPAEAARIAAPDPALAVRIAQLMPRLRAEERARDARALSEGRGLSPREQDIARRVGVRHPEKVRLLALAQIAPMTDPELARLFRVERAWGLTTGYGITVTQAPVPDWLLAHELVHVAQYERLGAEPMLRRTLTESLVLPGNLIPIEREAIARGDAVAKSPAYGY